MRDIPVPHGTRKGCKTYGCDCDPCREAARAYDRRVRRERAYGRWQPFVDAEPVREHVLSLKAAGMGNLRISELSNVSMKVIAGLLYGTEGRPPSRKVRVQTMQRLTAVRVSLEVMAPRARVDATGTRRRIQALTVLGWPQSVLAERLGMERSNINSITRNRTHVEVATALAVRSLYDELWNQRPPERDRRERWAASIARNLAAERGWAPPLAWDDETIDDPTAEPQGAGYVPGRCKLPEPGEIAHLIAGGDSAEVLADRYDVSVRYVRDRLDQQSEVTA